MASGEWRAGRRNSKFENRKSWMPAEIVRTWGAAVLRPYMFGEGVSSVHLAEDDVEGADDGDDVGDQVATDHFVQSLKIDE